MPDTLGRTMDEREFPDKSLTNGATSISTH